MRFTKRFFDIQSDKNNYSFENDFIAGFTAAAPENYDPDLDCNCPDPWCWPFTVDPYLVLEGTCAYDAGFQYGKLVHDELAECLENDENYENEKE